jgi:hypothetical protein
MGSNGASYVPAASTPQAHALDQIAVLRNQFRGSPVTEGQVTAITRGPKPGSTARNWRNSTESAPAGSTSDSATPNLPAPSRRCDRRLAVCRPPLQHVEIGALARQAGVPTGSSPADSMSAKAITPLSTERRPSAGCRATKHVQHPSTGRPPAAPSLPPLPAPGFPRATGGSGATAPPHGARTAFPERAVTRTSSRLATFTHTISSTSPTREQINTGSALPTRCRQRYHGRVRGLIGA